MRVMGVRLDVIVAEPRKSTGPDSEVVNKVCQLFGARRYHAGPPKCEWERPEPSKPKVNRISAPSSGETWMILLACSLFIVLVGAFLSLWLDIILHGFPA